MNASAEIFLFEKVININVYFHPSSFIFLQIEVLVSKIFFKMILVESINNV